MQKIKIGHRAKFRDRNKYLVQILFPVRAILRKILLTSGVLILIHSADTFVLVMACVDCVRACSLEPFSKIQPSSQTVHLLGKLHLSCRTGRFQAVQ